MSKSLNIAIVGATGLVGRTMLKVLEERDFPVKNIKLLASKSSAGKVMKFKGKDIKVEELKKTSFKGIDVALFSAGGEISKKFAPIAAENKTIVIDNSSYFRLDKEVPLVVPEVNPHHLKKHNYIIANPNCSTIQLLVVLNAINKEYGINRVVCSTYQSISGAGQKGVDKLKEEIADTNKVIGNHRIAYNAMFHPIDESGNSVEETKMVLESRKMLDMPKLRMSVTCVRLPIMGGHAESVNIETKKDFEVKNVHTLLNKEDGIIVIDAPQEEKYPTPYLVDGRDEVYVGRIRKDESNPKTMNLWVVADNLRKGAATNAVQIAEKLLEMKII
jgi:aspartate-semialdehyde dehydrogenase